jgi:uncharacterized protein (TIGR02466 family)
MPLSEFVPPPIVRSTVTLPGSSPSQPAASQPAPARQGAAAPELVNLFPCTVQISQIPDAAPLNQGLMHAVNEVKRTTPNSLPATWACHLYTTIHSPIDVFAHAEFAALKTHIMTEANRYADRLQLDTAKFPLRITSCWINVYNTTDAQEIHCHTNSVISGVYYVKAPPGSSPLTFHSPMAEVMLNPPYREMNDLNCFGASFDAIEGRMVLFRSWLRHSVKPSKIQDERVSVAFNITL